MLNLVIVGLGRWGQNLVDSIEDSKTALEAFAVDIVGGTPFPISPEEIHHATAVFETITISANTGSTVEVADI
jgi:hypothetical protein